MPDNPESKDSETRTTRLQRSWRRKVRALEFASASGNVELLRLAVNRYNPTVKRTWWKRTHHRYSGAVKIKSDGHDWTERLKGHVGRKKTGMNIPKNKKWASRGLHQLMVAGDIHTFWIPSMDEWKIKKTEASRWRTMSWDQLVEWLSTKGIEKP